MTDQKRARWATLRAGDSVRIDTQDGDSLYVELASVAPGITTYVLDINGDTHSSDIDGDIRLLRRPLTNAMTELDLPADVTVATIWDEDAADNEPRFEVTDGKRTYRAVLHWEEQTFHLEITRWYDGGAFDIAKYVVTPNGLEYRHGDFTAIDADAVTIRAITNWIYDRD